MIDEICIIGHTSNIGGAGTELDHQIDVWLALGMSVHIMPTSPPKDEAKQLNIDRGLIYHEWKDWPSIQDMAVISYCSRPFLTHLHEMRPYVKNISWVNCMTWCFNAETEAVKEGKLIDAHIFQTTHQMESIATSLLRNTSVSINSNLIAPYFRADDFEFQPQKPIDKFRICKINRADVLKVGSDFIQILQAIPSPNGKEAHIMAWNDKMSRKAKAFGTTPPKWVHTYAASQVPVRELYGKCHALVSQTDTYENLPRVGMEAMASGTILVVDNKGGWKDLVEHGVTGWLCDSPQDFVYYAARVAYEKDERIAMAIAANKKLRETFGSLPTAKDAWLEFFKSL